jgi:hypothetical protein
MGPLCAADLCWYEAFNMDSGSWWDENHDGSTEGDSGGAWIAMGDPEGPYFELVKRGQGPSITANGRGSLVRPVVTIDREQVGLSARWAFTTDGLAPCLFSVSLQPGNFRFVDEGLTGVFSEGSTLTQMIPPGEYQIQVEAGVPDAPDAACPWTVAFDRIEPGYVN